MPRITLDIDEQAEATISNCVETGKSFRIMGGRIALFDGQDCQLEYIEFRLQARQASGATTGGPGSMCAADGDPAK